MKTLAKGQKLPVTSEIGSSSFIVGLTWDQSSCPAYEIDASAFLLSERGKIEEEEDFVFYNNPSSTCGGVSMEPTPYSSYKKSYKIDLSRISAKVARVMFVLTIDNGDQLNHWFGNIKNISSVVINPSNPGMALEYPITDLTKETAVMAIELYKKNNEWRVQAVGNGFNSGLAALLKQYGSEKVQIIEESVPATKPNLLGNLTKPEPVSIPTPASSASPPLKINLSKITLDKKGESTKIDLSKHSGEKNEIHVNLNWNQTTKKSGFFRKAETLDLDLGCMFEMQSGEKGVIQALGGNMGSKYTAPYINLDKDDRSGAATDGENLFILRPDLIKRVIIFCFIYEGNSDFMEAGAYLTLKGMNQEITINLDNPRRNLTFCVGASIENQNGVIKIEKVDEYVKSHLECDKMFGFNFRWTAGSKD